MSIQNNTLINQSYLEYGKFVGITSDTRFPDLSVIRLDLSVPSASSVDTFSKYAILTYAVNSSYITTETRTSGNPTFTSSQVHIANTAGTAASPQVTLTSGTSCQIYIPATSVSVLNLAVSGVNTYAGCTITFFA